MVPVPEPVARVAELMSTFRPRWALCGGWAVDAWVGHQTRDHADVDIAVLQKDLSVLFTHLAGWQMIAHDPQVAGDTSEIWDGRCLALPAHIHARSPDARDTLPKRMVAPVLEGFDPDIQINERSGRDWVISREPLVARSLLRGIRRPAWSVPTVAPEVLLVYKSKDLRPNDELDLPVLLPHLTEGQRRWLRGAISLAHPGHPWLARLSI